MTPDELPFSYPTEDRPALAGPKRHRHVWGPWAGTREPVFIDGKVANVWCTRCGKVRDEAASRRGRNNRKRGNRYELTAARDSGGVKVGHHGGPADVINDMFVWQSKYYAPGRFPGWMADELAKLPRTGGRIPVLRIGEAAGSGRRGRAVVVLTLADWLDLHGPTASTTGCGHDSEWHADAELAMAETHG